MHQTLLLLPGDGISPEVIAEVRRVAEVVAPDLKLEEGLVGGASIDAHGDPLTEDTLAHARHASAVLLGAVGGPKWVGAARDKRPEAGLLALRKGLDVFANLRPAFCFPALVEGIGVAWWPVHIRFGYSSLCPWRSVWALRTPFVDHSGGPRVASWTGVSDLHDHVGRHGSRSI